MGCLIWLGMYGSGVGTGTESMNKRLRLTHQGQVRARIACFAVAAGTTLPGTAKCGSASAVCPTTGSVVSAFALSCPQVNREPRLSKDRTQLTRRSVPVREGTRKEKPPSLQAAKEAGTSMVPTSARNPPRPIRRKTRKQSRAEAQSRRGTQPLPSVTQFVSFVPFVVQAPQIPEPRITRSPRILQSTTPPSERQVAAKNERNSKRGTDRLGAGPVRCRRYRPFCVSLCSLRQSRLRVRPHGVRSQYGLG